MFCERWVPKIVQSSLSSTQLQIFFTTCVPFLSWQFAVCFFQFWKNAFKTLVFIKPLTKSKAFQAFTWRYFWGAFQQLCQCFYWTKWHFYWFWPYKSLSREKIGSGLVYWAKLLLWSELPSNHVLAGKPCLFSAPVSSLARVCGLCLLHFIGLP